MEKKLILHADDEVQTTVKEFMHFMNTIPGFHITEVNNELIIRWEESVYRRHARHNGGRRVKTVSRKIEFTGGYSMKELLKMQENAIYTCYDVLQMQEKQMRPEEIAAVIGISRATYFRRLRTHRQNADFYENSRIPF